MEAEVAQAQNLKLQRAKENEEVNSLKMESEQTLTKAKSIIFERTKVIKNQELQIEAYSQQIESLKDVVRITKDLLEIRNLEVKQLENKINCMEERMRAERERQDLIHKKLETMIRHNGELKREYEAQLCLFTALRERYNERELARDVVDNMRGKKVPEAVNGVAEMPSSSGADEASSSSETLPSTGPQTVPEEQPTEQKTDVNASSEISGVTKSSPESQQITSEGAVEKTGAENVEKY